MKKYLFVALAVLAGLFTACQQDLPELTGEGEQNVTISVSVPNQAVATRAGSTEFADPTLSGMRVALIISTEDNKVITVTTKDHSFGSGSTACSFETRLYKGKTYNISVWADFGATYYTIPTQPETEDEAATTLPVVKMASTTITGSNNNYDAYYGNVTQAISGNENINVTLTRPFALVKVNTTDWNENAIKLAGYRPDNYTTSFTAPTQLNLVSGVADSTQAITTSAAIVAYDKDSTLKELHYDYLFANATSSILPDFEVSYKQGTTENSTYVFENIPVQRNYQTNITGNILTKKGNISVEITPDWNQPDAEVVCKDVENIASANDVVAANTDKKEINVTFSSEPSDAGDPTQAGSGNNAIVTSLLAEDATYNITVASTNSALYIGDYDYDNSGSTITYNYNTILAAGDSKTHAASVNLIVTNNMYIGTLVVNSPSKSVSINGQTLASGKAYHIENLTVTEVSMNTVIIESGMSVGTLTMVKGGLEIHGTVNSVVIPDVHGTIKVRACEGLSETVYNTLKDYIDVENGYFGEQESGKSTYCIRGEVVAKVGETDCYTLTQAFAAVQNGGTITLMKNCETGSQYDKDEPLKLTVPNVTIDLNGMTITESNNFSFVIAADNVTIKNGNITAGPANTAAYSCGYYPYALVVGAIDLGEKVTGIKIQDIVFTGGVSIGGSTNNKEAACKGSGSATIENCSITSGNFSVLYVQPANSDVTVLSGTFTKHEKSAQTSFLDTEGTGSYIYLKGGTYNADPSAYVAENYEAKKTGENEWTVSAKPVVAKVGGTDCYTLAQAFTAVQDGGTITLTTDCETGASYSESSMLALTKSNVTLDLNGKTITETNNFSFIIAGNNVIVKNGTIKSGYNEDKTCKYHSYALAVGGKATSDKVTGVQIQDIVFTGGVSIGGSIKSNEAEYKGAAEVTIEGCTITSGDWYTICVQPENSSSAVTVLSGTYKHKDSQYSKLFSTDTGCTISLKGGTYDANPSDYLADGCIYTDNGNNTWTVEKAFVYEQSDSKYHIYNFEGLKMFRDAVNGGNTYVDQTIVLEANVNLASVDNWEPIGLDSTAFNGTFDGNSKTISNLKVNRNRNAGLFGHCFNHGYIKNLTVDKATITTNHYAGAILASGYADVINCHVTNSNITCSAEQVGTGWDNGDKAGALVGFIGEGAYKVQNCSSTNCTVTGYRDLGGLVGYKYADAQYKNNTVTGATITVDNTHNYYSYTANAQYDAHAIVGECNGGLDSSNSSTNVTINYPY